MQKTPIVPKGIVFPFILLTTLFFAWAVPNNLGDTMLAAFKRIMSLSDSKTAWIQVVCYFLGYGCFAIPGALFIKRYTYKSGVMLGLGLYSAGALLFYPAMLFSSVNIDLSFGMYLGALFILFAGLSILETSTNSYVYAIGPEETATRRLNFAQSFNPFGAISGGIIAQVFVLSNLNVMTAAERASLPPAELTALQTQELTSVSYTYMTIGVVMFCLLLAILVTRMPKLREDNKSIDFKATIRRLFGNRHYAWSVVAQFFYVGAQVAVWSFMIRYIIQELHFNEIIESLGAGATSDQVVAALRGLEPLAAGFYNFFDWVGLDVMLPRTAEQAAATYYIMALVLFVIARFVCTWLMKYFKPQHMLTTLAVLAVICCMIAVFAHGTTGVYGLVCISGCMSMMFPTIFGMGIGGLGDDTKLGGSFMVMAIAGAAVLTQIQGIVSDGTGSIKIAFLVPTIAFAIIAYYGAVVCKKG